MQEKHEVIKERLRFVRERMKTENVDIFVVFTDDYHMSEYSGAYFADREYLSGFTGSAGTLAVTQTEAALFTDGRYFVQAQAQLEGTGITLMKMGCAGVPTLTEYIRERLGAGGVLGMDARTCAAQTGMEWIKLTEACGGRIKGDFMPVQELWKDRPAFPASKAYELELKYSGESREDKIHRIYQEMETAHAAYHAVASLDDICWILNLRGDDVACNPVIMAYLLFAPNAVYLYTEESRFTQAMKADLAQDGIQLRPYNQIYADLRSLAGKKTSVWMDMKRVNLALFQSVPETAECICKENPSVHMKAVKNPTELANLRDVHIDDGLAVTKFMYWLKNTMKHYEAGKEWNVTEVTAAEYLDNLRSHIPDYKELSFDTISAYGENAAMMHYHAEKDHCAVLYPRGMLLVDSGGQYLRGTTDITRTFALGEVTAEMKKYFTLTLKGMLNLANARFLKGCTGFSLDILARGPLWEQGMDYRCGTGHGIGYLLNVHESPNGFRWKHNPGRNDLCVFEEGMVTSDEPGVYIEGAYGIRIENEIECVGDGENEYGTFLKFEPLTFVPIDLDLVDTAWLEKKDIERLNAYHAAVYSRLSPYLSGEELEFLKQYTRPVE